MFPLASQVPGNSNVFPPDSNSSMERTSSCFLESLRVDVCRGDQVMILRIKIVHPSLATQFLPANCISGPSQPERDNTFPRAVTEPAEPSHFFQIRSGAALNDYQKSNFSRVPFQHSSGLAVQDPMINASSM